MNEVDTFTIYEIIDFGIIPFEELFYYGYNSIELLGLESNGIYYPVSSNSCLSMADFAPLHPQTKLTSSFRSSGQNSLNKYAYNKYGSVVSVHHTDGCNLSIYEHTEEGVNLIVSRSNVYGLEVDTDDFFTNSRLAGHYQNENGMASTFSLLKINGDFSFHDKKDNFQYFMYHHFRNMLI